MEEVTKFDSSHVAVCLKAIKNYLHMDEAIVTKDEQGQLKEKAQKATEHLYVLFSPETADFLVSACPAENLPTID